MFNFHPHLQFPCQALQRPNRPGPRQPRTSCAVSPHEHKVLGACACGSTEVTGTPWSRTLNLCGDTGVANRIQCERGSQRFGTPGSSIFQVATNQSVNGQDKNQANPGSEGKKTFRDHNRCSFRTEVKLLMSVTLAVRTDVHGLVRFIQKCRQVRAEPGTGREGFSRRDKSPTGRGLLNEHPSRFRKICGNRLNAECC